MARFGIGVGLINFSLFLLLMYLGLNEDNRGWAIFYGALGGINFLFSVRSLHSAIQDICLSQAVQMEQMRIEVLRKAFDATNQPSPFDGEYEYLNPNETYEDDDDLNQHSGRG